MRAAITGAAGFIGAHLAQKLREGGCEVLATDVRPAEGVTVCSVHGASYATLLASFEPTVVIHLAGQQDVACSIIDPVGDVNLNVVGTVEAYMAAKAAGAQRFVYPGTWCWYDPDQPRPWHEGTPMRPSTPYGASKAAAYRHLQVLETLGGPAVATCVLGNVYGLCDTSVVSAFARAIRDGHPPTVTEGATRDLVHVHDVVNALIAAAQPGALATTCNIATGVETNLADLARTMCRIAGIDDTVTLRPPGRDEVLRVRLTVRRAERNWGFVAARPRVDPDLYSLMVGLAVDLCLSGDASRSGHGINTTDHPDTSG